MENYSLSAAPRHGKSIGCFSVLAVLFLFFFAIVYPEIGLPLALVASIAFLFWYRRPKQKAHRTLTMALKKIRKSAPKDAILYF